MTACRPWNQLVRDVKFILENTACRSMQVEPAFNIQRGTHLPPHQNQYRKFSMVFIKAHEVALQYHATLTYSGARPGIVTRTFCTAPYNAIVINPEDAIVACYEIVNGKQPLSKISVFGSITNGDIIFNQSKRDRFYELLRDRWNITCKNCFCRWSCAGDCFPRAFSSGENGHLEENPRCDMNREITKNLILDLIYKHEGVWRGMIPVNEQDECG
jgi:uncharacterized protein